MKAMIPHHSSAIMTSSNVDFKDPEAKKLAEYIIAAQEREIKQMNEIIIPESKKIIKETLYKNMVCGRCEMAFRLNWKNGALFFLFN
jgi:hypothetical protein